jgi:hypothetical protein
MVEFTEIELKLLRLMLGSGAQPGEVSVSSTKLAESLRKRGVSSQDIEEALSGSVNESGDGIPAKVWRPDYGLCTMPFGPTKGQRFMDISPYELRKVLAWLHRDPDHESKERKFADLIHDINEFLKQ